MQLDELKSPAAVAAAAEEKREATVRRLVELIRLDTSNPPGNEKLVADYVAAFCEERGIRFRLFKPGGGRTSLVMELGGRRDGSRLLIPAHADVVPAGDGWSVPPFEGVVRDGYVWGRGAVDNKGPLAGLLTVAELLQPAANDLPGTLLLGVLADEERGSALGLERLLEEGALQAEAAFVPDIPCGLRAVELAEKGYLDVKVVFHGRQAHSSTPEQGASALAAAAEFLVAVEKRRPQGGDEPHPFLSPTTMVAAVAEAGSAPNMVPGKAELTLNLRFLPGQTPKGLAAEIRSWAEETAARRKGITAEVRVETTLPPSEVPADSPVVRALRNALAETTGTEPCLIGIGGATFCKQLVTRGIPAVAYGPGEETAAHAADERLAISELERFVVATTAAVRNFFFA